MSIHSLSVSQSGHAPFSIECRYHGVSVRARTSRVHCRECFDCYSLLVGSEKTYLVENSLTIGYCLRWSSRLTKKCYALSCEVSLEWWTLWREHRNSRDNSWTNGNPPVVYYFHKLLGPHQICTLSEGVLSFVGSSAPHGKQKLTSCRCQSVRSQLAR